MRTGPFIKLSIDLHEMDKYFPLNLNLEGRLDYDLIIDRRRFEEVSGLLKVYHISNRQLIQEFCFIILWIEKEIRAMDDRDNPSGKYHPMWVELDHLKQYLLNNRITAISFSGEYERDKPGESLTLKDEMNIDRICDGLRSIFRKEFQDKKENKGSVGQIAWKRKKMGLVKNNLLKYLDSVPKLEILSLESQLYIIGKLSALAGFYKSEEDYVSASDPKHDDPYQNYLIQNIKALK